MATKYDVVVVGAGNAALSAAIAAREISGSVLVLEKAPEFFRGGNTYFTGGIIRFAFNGMDDMQTVIPDMSPTEVASVEVGSYTEDEYYADMMRVTHGLSDPELAQILVSNSLGAMQWLQKKGVRFVLAYGRQAFKDGDKYRFWGGLLVEAVGAGKGLSDQQFDVCQREGIEVRYSTQAVSLRQDETGRVCGLRALGPDGFEEISCSSVVLAAGGFESNAEMRCRYLGPGWELVKVRGIPYNTGDAIKMALDVGAQAHGHYSSCHAVAWDMNAPPFGDRTITELFQKHSYPLGIMVNTEGNRFVDEGEDYRNLTYVRFGGAIMEQPRRTAVQIFDQKTVAMLRDEYRIREVTKAESDTIRGLAEALEIDPDGLVRTVADYNADCRPGDYNPAILDGVRTEGLSPAKSNWALPLDDPPYVGFVTTTGVTFTFGGLRIDAGSEVQDLGYRSIPGLYAAGELVGGLFYENYPGGSGLMAGAVFGRRAGRFAAQYATA